LLLLIALFDYWCSLVSFHFFLQTVDLPLEYLGLKVEGLALAEVYPGVLAGMMLAVQRIVRG